MGDLASLEMTHQCFETITMQNEEDFTSRSGRLDKESHELGAFYFRSNHHGDALQAFAAHDLAE